MTEPDEEPERSKGGDYPTDDLEREAVGLPPLSSDRRDKVQPPQLVHIAFLLFSAAAALLVVGFGVMLAHTDEITDALLDAYEDARRAGDATAGRRGITPADVESGVPGLLWLLTVGAVMIAGLVVLFAYKAREGTRSARTVLLALLALLAVFVVGMPSEFVNPVTVASLVVAVGALVLLYLPGVSDYFPRLPKTQKRWRDYT